MTTTTHTHTDPKIQSVQRLYEAYGARDFDAVLAELADDVDWAAEAASTSVPWYGSYRGKDQVPGFFEAIGANIDTTEFTVVSMTSNDTDVVATIHWSYTVNAVSYTHLTLPTKRIV